MVDGPGFGERLAAAVSSRGPLCVGVDPHPELLRQWGWDAGVEGLARFCDVCVEAFGDFALVKPQVAFFEAYGSAGFAVLERTMAALRERGALVLADAKRGDIGSTMAAYAQAWAGNGPLAADAVTASPYLGFGALQPLIDLAAANRRGVFVLAATSNPEGGSVQRAVLDGRTVAQAIVDEAAAVNRADDRPGAVGVVVGATLARAEVPDLSGLGGPVLVPGVGVQGGNPEGLAGFGGARRGQLLPAAAREILRCGPDVGALRAAADRLRDAVGYLA